MTRAELKAATVLEKAATAARDFRDEFAAATEPFVIFSQIFTAEQSAGEDESRSLSGWEGEIEVPRDMALELLEWIEQAAKKRLAELGVEP